MQAVAAIRGIELSYETHGNGEPLLLLHGGFGVADDFKLLFDFAELSRQYRVIAVDLRGHGRSTNPSGTITLRECALDVLALADELGVDRFKVIAVSLGAKTMLHVATLAPSRVEAMVLAAAAPYFPEQARRIMLGVTDEGHSDAEWTQARARHRHGDEQIRALWRMPRQLVEHADEERLAPEKLRAISARTLIVNGDRDPLYPIELSVELHRAIFGSALWVLPSSGHAPVFGRARASFARAALAFLRGEPIGD